MRIGVYSGTFDPVHSGHVAVAAHVARSGAVDAVWLMPSRLNPLKRGSLPSATDAQRLEMARIATRGLPGVEVSDFEMGLPSPSYTFDTLSALADRFPQHSFVQVIGSDNWRDFSLWRRHGEILERFGVVIYPRPGAPVEGPLPANAVLLGDAPQFDVAATDLRKSIAEGRDVSRFLPPGVLSYIKQNEIYG